MKKAVIYTRSASPNEQAMNAQLEICREYANAHGYIVVAEYSDNGYSGMNFNRPAFIAMNNSRDKWATVIVSSIERLSRNHSDLREYRKTLHNEGKEIVSTAKWSDSLQELYTDFKGVQNK